MDLTHKTITCKGKYFTRSRIILNLISSFVYYYILMLVAFMDVMFGPLFPILAKRTFSSIPDMGWIVTIGTIGNIIGTPIGAYLFHKCTRYDQSEKYNRFLSINGILFFNCILMVIYVYPTTMVENYWVLLFLQLLLACSHAVGDVGSNLAIGYLWRERVYPFMQLLHFFESMGYIVAPLLTSQIFEYVEKDTHQLFIICCFIGFLIIGALFFLIIIPSPTAPLDPKKGYEVNDNIIGINWGNSNTCCLGFSLDRIKKTVEKFCTVHTFVCVIIGLVKGIETDFFQEFGNMIFSYGNENNLGTDIERSYLLTCFWVVLTVSRLLSVLWVVLIGDAYLIMLSLAANIVTLSVMYVFHDSYTIYWVGSLLHAFFVAPLTASCFSYPQSFFGKPITSYSIAVIDFVCSFGIIASTIVNLTWNKVDNALYLCGIVVFICLFLMMIMLAFLRVFLDFIDFFKNRLYGEHHKHHDFPENLNNNIASYNFSAVMEKERKDVELNSIASYGSFSSVEENFLD